MHKNLALKPANISFEQAAAVPVAALTALQALRDKGQIQAGRRVLINGAAGGVGTFAVQIARALGAAVTGVCSTRNQELVRSLGAEQVVDYTQRYFSRSGQRYDMILDNVGNLSLAHFKRALVPGGKGVIIGFTSLTHMFGMLIQSALLSGGLKIGNMLTIANQADLNEMSRLLQDGRVVPVIDRRYPLSETAAAICCLETGRARGKVIITVAPDS